MSNPVSDMEPATKNGEYELQVVKQFHDEAYIQVDRALSLEESCHSLEAMAVYEHGLRLLNQGLEVSCDRPSYIGERWDTVRLLQMKMRKTKDHVLTRLEDLSKARAGEAAPPYAEMPPSYEEACFDGPYFAETSKKSFHDLCREQLPQPMDTDCLEAYSQVPAEAEQVFSIADGSQIFFVSASGSVSAPSHPTALAIYRFRDGSMTPTGQRRPPAFLQIGQWVYPLHPGRMPVLHTSYGAYMLPDTNSAQPGAAVGVLLSEDVPPATREVFEHLMCELTALESQPQPTQTERRLSTKISDGIMNGAEMVSKGVVITAEKTSEYVRLGAQKLRQQMAPVNSPAHVDPRIQKGMQIAKDVSGAAVRVSGFILNQLGRATMALGNQLAPHIRRHGTRLISKAMGEENQPEKASATMDGMLEVASGGLKGFSTVYMGLEQAAKILATNLISETVQTVNYKYGAEAAQTTGTTLHTVTNVAMTANNVNHMGIKAIAKRAAKDTGKSMVYQHEHSKDASTSEKDLSNGSSCSYKKGPPPDL